MDNFKSDLVIVKLKCGTEIIGYRIHLEETTEFFDLEYPIEITNNRYINDGKLIEHIAFVRYNAFSSQQFITMSEEDTIHITPLSEDVFASYKAAVEKFYNLCLEIEDVCDEQIMEDNIYVFAGNSTLN